MSLFHDAAQDGDLKLLRKASKRDVARLDADGMAPLHWVAWSGNTDAAIILLQKGAAVELGDKSGNAALHVAAQFGNVKLMRHLVEQAGASVWALNDDGKTPCETAAEAEQNAAFRYLDGLQLRLRMDNSDRADKARQRARKDWTKRQEHRQKQEEKERSTEEAASKLRQQLTSESVLPSNAIGSQSRGQASHFAPRPSAVEPTSHQEPGPGRRRGYSDPVLPELVDVQHAHPDIVEERDSDDEIFRSRSQSLLHSRTSTSSGLIGMKAQSVDRPSVLTNQPAPNHSRSPEDQSAAQAMAMYNSSNLRSRFSLRPSTSGSALSNSTSGVGTDMSGLSSQDTSMGSTSGSRTAQAIARIKGLGGLSALTHSKTPGRLRHASVPAAPAQPAEDTAFRRYRVQSDSSGQPLKKATSGVALMQMGTSSNTTAMSRSTSNASGHSKMSTVSMPAKLQSRPAGGATQTRRRPSRPRDDGVASDLDENDLTALAALLHMLDLDGHLAMLQEEHMDLDALMLCTELDLKDLDMGLGPRRKILAAVQKRKTTLGTADSHRLTDSLV